MSTEQLCVKLRQRLLVVETNITRAKEIDPDRVVPALSLVYLQLYRDELAMQRRFLHGLLQHINGAGETEEGSLYPGCPNVLLHSEGIAL